ncbi:hypothetical protein K525DRAFT_258920, partial [Schizophyllum commune Loenen D]
DTAPSGRPRSSALSCLAPPELHANVREQRWMIHRQHMQQLMSICTALSTNDRPRIHHRASMDPSKPPRPLRIVFEPGIASVAIVG